jgi:type 1 glutamine amidotransferase
MSRPARFLALALPALAAAVLPARVGAQAAPRFKVLVIAQLKEEGSNSDEIHRPFVEAATPWLNQLAKDSNFTVTYLTSPNTVTDATLSDVDLIWQMNYTPFGWNTTAQAAFQKYIESGKNWVGDHHAGLYGLKPPTNPNEPLWTWYGKFIGGVKYQNYVASFAKATVRIEDTAHPIFRGVHPTFSVAKDEWYTWDKSPRLSSDIKVLANVDESSYQPSTNIKMNGDHPVIWSNISYKGRCVYIFVGHDPGLFQNADYTTLLRNALMWAANKPPPAPIAKAPARPNPGNLRIQADKRSISLSVDHGRLESVAILDASGKTLFRGEGQAAASGLDRTKWSAGSYLVQAIVSGGQASRWIRLP